MTSTIGHLFRLWAFLAIMAGAYALVPATAESGSAQGRTAATAQLQAGSATAAPVARQTYMIAYHEIHAGKELTGHKAAVDAAGGEVIAVHPEIAVIVAKSRSSSFSSDVKKADSRILVCAKPCSPLSYMPQARMPKGLAAAIALIGSRRVFLLNTSKDWRGLIKVF